jgi:hypothetical protein
MKDRPILMCGEMVRATLDGTKTQTRRIVLKHPTLNDDYDFKYFRDTKQGKLRAIFFANRSPKRKELLMPSFGVDCPYGVVGSKLWVKENHRLLDCLCKETCRVKGYVYYEADQSGYDGASTCKLRPSIHMPRWASRLTLEITEVRVERVQDITEADAKAEGVPASKNVEMKDGSPCYRIPYQILWNQINGCDAWDKNPWCWCITFRRL